MMWRFPTFLHLVGTVLIGASASAQTLDRQPPSRAALMAGAPVAVESAAPDTDTVDRVVVLLSGYEYFPSQADLVAVVADPVPHLLTIVYDVDGRWLPTHHHRALGALAYFPSELTRAHLDYLLTDARTPDLMRHHVINALANGFAEAALTGLEPYLYDTDLQLRLTAVAAIGSVESNGSVRLLQSALAVETHDLVVERIQRTLTSEPFRPYYQAP